MLHPELFEESKKDEDNADTVKKGEGENNPNKDGDKNQGQGGEVTIKEGLFKDGTQDKKKRR